MGQPHRPRYLALLALNTLLATAQSASAQTTTASDKALAEALFAQGREAMQKGNVAEACPKLAESYRVDPAVGTLLNLAVCHEQEGKLASAWAEFSDAAAESKRTGNKEREHYARRKIEALKARVPMITLRVADAFAATEGASVQLDGRTIGRAAWTAVVPVDPGLHRVDASAPGRRPYTAAIEVLAGATAAIEIPALEQAAPAPAPAPARAVVPPEAPAPARIAPAHATPLDETTPTAHPLRIVGLVAGVAGILGLGVGSALGISAMANKSERDRLCTSPSNRCATQEGVDADKSARSDARLSTIGFVAGGTLLAAGAVLFAIAPRRMSADASTPVRVAVSVSGSAAGIDLAGAF